MSEVSSGSKSPELLVSRVENSTFERGLLWERFPVGFRFSRSTFWDVPGTDPESVRACGFKRSSSNLDRISEVRDSVLLNTWENSLVNLPSTSSEFCVMYSWVNPGADVFCDWLFLVMFCFFSNSC